MTNPEKCGKCGTLLEPADSQARKPCPVCGSTPRIFEASFTASLELHGSVRFKHKRPGQKRPVAEGTSGDELFHDKAKWVQKERLIDREKNRYREKVTDPATGEVIHECDEPLDHHKGHGTAKPKRSL